MNNSFGGWKVEIGNRPTESHLLRSTPVFPPRLICRPNVLSIFYFYSGPYYVLFSELDASPFPGSGRVVAHVEQRIQYSTCLSLPSKGRRASTNFFCQISIVVLFHQTARRAVDFGRPAHSRYRDYSQYSRFATQPTNTPHNARMLRSKSSTSYYVHTLYIVHTPTQVDC